MLRQNEVLRGEKALFVWGAFKNNVSRSCSSLLFSILAWTGLKMQCDSLFISAFTSLVRKVTDRRRVI